MPHLFFRQVANVVLVVILPVVIVMALSVGAASAMVVRTWKSHDGVHSIDAEFVECKDGRVSLRKGDGDVISVPVSRLSAEDQAYVIEQTSLGPKKRTFTQLTQASNRLHAATDVLRLYRLFIEDESVPEAEREAAKKQLPIWKERADKQMVRVGIRWVTPAEANDQRLQARQLTDEAIRLIGAGQDNAAIDKCVKASRIDVDSILADFLQGLIYALVRCDAKLANQHLSECVSRDPRSIPALNNLALSEIRLRKYAQALAHWQTAIEVAPSSHQVIQNLGRLLELTKRGRVNIPPSLQRRFADLYAAAAVSANAGKFKDGTGWLYMGYYAPLTDSTDHEKAANSATSHTNTAIIKTGSGTGFVVKSGYVLTNRHVVAGHAAWSVVPSGNKSRELSASLVGVADGDDDDFAVIRCPELTAPPLRFVNETIVPRGTEVMVLGFPGMIPGRMPSLKSTRGTVAGLPDDSYNAYILDAIVNPGNSGGPVCDATGSVLGILYARTAVTEENYGLAVPHSRILQHLKKWIPDYDRLPPSAEVQKWTTVDGIASRSTVLIWIQDTESKPWTRPPAKSKQSETVAPFEDRWCMTCYGRGTVKCRDCQNGTVRAYRKEVKGRNPVSGQIFYWDVPIRVPCKVCHGTGFVRCPDCHHGIEKGLR